MSVSCTILNELARYAVPPIDQGIPNTLTLGGIEFILFSAELANSARSWTTDRLNLSEMRLKPREIESWFVALGLLEQRQKTADDEFDSYLQNILKDGSILCRLVNRVKPGTINKVKSDLLISHNEICFSSLSCKLAFCESVRWSLSRRLIKGRFQRKIAWRTSGHLRAPVKNCS